MRIRPSKAFATAALCFAAGFAGVTAGIAASPLKPPREANPRFIVDDVNCTVSLRLPFPSKLEQVEYRYTLNEAAFTYSNGVTETRHMLWLSPGDTQTGKNWVSKLPAYCTMGTTFAPIPQKLSIP